MRIYLPTIPSVVIDPHFMRTFADELTRSQIPAVSQDEAVAYLHLQASDGSIWKVTVDPLGVLTTTKVQG